jgi:PPK2 family polyphosphate:nucleotide phosphotransferase
VSPDLFYNVFIAGKFWKEAPFLKNKTLIMRRLALKRYRVEPGSRVKLGRWDANDRGEFSGNRRRADSHLNELHNTMADWQELLYAEHRHRILVILQAMDTGGKDSTIKKVFGPLNPQGTRVVNFKEPSKEELDRDYLWRAHLQVPRKGEIVIFNRSYYEDVLVVRVHNLVDRKVWSRRFSQINEFERMLWEEGTTILKFYLHIDLEEQRKRLEERIQDPKKHWKLSPSDLPERKLWPEYMQAYEDAIARTSTKWAPWYIIPANRKWYRNILISRILNGAMRRLKMEYPEPQVDVKKLRIE